MWPPCTEYHLPGELWHQTVSSQHGTDTRQLCHLGKVAYLILGKNASVLSCVTQGSKPTSQDRCEDSISYYMQNVYLAQSKSLINVIMLNSSKQEMGMIGKVIFFP